jgi:FkbM family methyltransferase
MKIGQHNAHINDLTDRIVFREASVGRENIDEHDLMSDSVRRAINLPTISRNRDAASLFPDQSMFISHAQNFEDVILMRAFKDVQNGFYIDVGAQDPVADSVSLAFYNKGWRGIHVEPNPFYAAKLRAARPDEEIIEAVVGTGSGDTIFYVIGETGLSTGRQDIARTYDRSDIYEIKVPTISLARILNGVTGDVHWLKIDVEGMEASVLKSWKGSNIRPWIIVIESTLPNSQVPDHQAWERLLVSRGYSPVYFDGVNKFYVHEGRTELRSVFGPGPNCFDEFKLDSSSGYVDAPHLVEAQQEHRDAIKRIEARIKEFDATRKSESKSHAAAVVALEAEREKWSKERIAALAELAEAQNAQRAAEGRVSELLTAHREAASAHAAALTRLESAQQEWHVQRIALVAELDEARSSRLAAEGHASELLTAHKEAASAHAAALTRLESAQQEWHVQRIALVAELDEARSSRLAAEGHASELLTAHKEAASAHAAALTRLEAAQQEWHVQRIALVAELDEARSSRLAAESHVSKLLTAHRKAASAHAVALTRLKSSQQEWRAQRTALLAELNEARAGGLVSEKRRMSELSAAQEEASKANAAAVATLEMTRQKYEQRLYELWVDSVGLRNQLTVISNQLAVMNGSFSWRVTRPVRIVSNVLRGVFGSLGSRPFVGRALIRVAEGNPQLRRLTTAMLRRHPVIDQFAKRLVKRALSERLGAGQQSAIADGRQLGGGTSFVQQNPPIISSRAQAILSHFENEYLNKGVGG